MPSLGRKITNYVFAGVATFSSGLAAYIANTQDNHSGAILSYAVCGIVGVGSIGALLYLNKDYLLCKKQAARAAAVAQLEFDDTDLPQIESPTNTPNAAVIELDLNQDRIVQPDFDEKGNVVGYHMANYERPDSNGFENPYYESPAQQLTETGIDKQISFDLEA